MTTDELPDFQGPYDVTGGVTKRHAVSRASRPAPSTDSPMTEAEALHGTVGSLGLLRFRYFNHGLGNWTP